MLLLGEHTLIKDIHICYEVLTNSVTVYPYGLTRCTLPAIFFINGRGMLHPKFRLGVNEPTSRVMNLSYAYIVTYYSVMLQLAF